ncbi:cadherin domain-containing protein [Hymenobacter sp. ASUV-10]|uniref:Cadherin domain-containing protein n=1 Tax=Hymenobacter aranciens TaxID=3063996 RepID=A0ABT9B9E1_9BACT|nr:cadherin domain-containing protein [Hymenobacter sp. ASUV-10]MDO7874420.1 cadherin domain-containing protein [Hymenobacter sp. ASUV-10]
MQHFSLSLPGWVARPPRRWLAPLVLALLVLGLPLAGRAQLTVNSRTPARNARAAARGANLTATFSQPLDPATAGAGRVFSQQRGGQLVRGGNATASGSTLSVDPAADLQAGETVFVTLPASLSSSTGTAAPREVYQVTAAAPLGGNLLTDSYTLAASGQRLNDAAVGDLNGDGRLDLLVQQETSLRPYFNTGTGAAYTAGTAFGSISSNAPLRAILADVDGDGDLDAVQSRLPVRVYKNDGSGGFGPASPYGSSTGFGRAVGVADVDADGDLDILTIVQTSNFALTVLLNDGTGTYTQAGSYSTGSSDDVPALAVGDYNNDGKLDVAYCAYSGGGVTVLLGNGSGGFAAASGSPFATGGSANAIAATDFNNDGTLDLVVGTNTTPGRLYLLLGTGAGAFSPASGSPFTAGNRIQSLAVADVNADGNPDVLLANYGTAALGAVSTHLGTGAGSFGTATNFTATANGGRIAAGDFNGDGAVDVVTIDEPGDALKVLLNQASLPAPTLTSLAPTSGPEGTSVTLTGTNFTSASTVSFNGTAASVTFTSATSLTAVVPAGATTGNVTVTTTAGTSGGVVFTVTLPAPTLTGLSPASGSVGTSVTLTGTGFTSGSTVSFNGTAASSVNFTSATSLTAVVPTGATSGNVTVTTTAGTSAPGSANYFSVTLPNNAPTALSLSPQSVAENAGANALVGTFATTDPDAGDTFTYTLVSGAGSADNGSFIISGSTLRLRNSADYETRNSYTVRVRTTDQGGLSVEQDFTISITDVNDAPVIANQTRSVAENTANGTTVGGPIAANDADAGTTLSYSLTGGNGTGAFALNSSTGQLTVADVAQLDYETTPTFILTVQVSDGSLTSSATVTVNLTNVNEAPSIAAQTRSVAENSANGTNVGAALTASDPDANPTLSYSITAGNSAGKFAINSSTGQLTVAGTLDYETTPSYSLTVRVSDGSLTSSATVTVNILDVNEAPSIGNQVRKVAENSPNGTNVDTPIVASDADANPTLSYSITAGNSAGKFAINSSTGQLTVAGALDYETTNSYSLTVQVSDGSLSSTATVTVSILNVNDAPVIAAQTRSVAENTANGTTVGGPIVASDADAGTTLSYSLTGGNGTGTGAFALNSSTGQLTVADVAQLDYETTPTFALTVQVSDGSLSSTATVTVNLTNVNEAPTALSLSPQSVAENAGPNALVGTFTTTDPDAANTFTYTLTGGAGSADNFSFAISGSTLLLRSSADYETKNSYAVRVRTTDQGGLSVEQSFTISITDVNEAPSLRQTNYLVEEDNFTNRAQAPFQYQLIGSDPDANTTLTYRITAGNQDGRFALSSTGQLTLAAPLDYETTRSYSLTVEVSDGSLTGSNTINIIVRDENEAPTALRLSPQSVAENAGANATVGTFTSTDPDANNTFTYALASGAGSADNAAFTISGSTLRLTASADYEARTSYAVRVRTTDQGGLFFEQTFTIGITNVNEAPTALSLSPQSVAENAGTNALVGTFTTTDPDAGNTFTYALVSGAGSTDNLDFAISGSTLLLRSSADYETRNSYTVRVRTTDQGGLSVEQSFTISITNVNEAPSLQPVNDIVFEDAFRNPNRPFGIRLRATDPDANTTTLTYRITAGNQDGRFALSSAGILTLVAPLDYETTTSYTLTVEVSDGSLTGSNTVTIQVIDVPAPTLTSLSPTSGPSGTSVTLTGTNLGGATVVTFNGIAAAFSVSRSGTSISTNVPTGASTGNVVVTTPEGTSNGLAFTVTSSLTTRWTGAVSTDWFTAGNWNDGVPGNVSDITLTAGAPRYPLLTAGTAEAKSLSIGSNASLSQSGGTLSVSGTFGNDGSLNQSGGTLSLRGSFFNNGSATLAGLVQLVGSGSQTLGGSSALTFERLTVNKPGGSVSLNQNLTIGTALTLTSGTLVTGYSALNLGSNATISETETAYVTGFVSTTRNLNTRGSGSDFGGLGVTLTPAASSTTLPGSTLVQRITGSPATGVGSSVGITRYFLIIPAVDANLNVTMVFNYFDHERNGIAEADLQLFKQPFDPGSGWARVNNATYDASANTVTRAGLTSFSTWTLGSRSAPLPVELTRFAATAEGAVARLTWTTASEKNSAYFEVQASPDGTDFRTLGQVPAAGTSTQARSYAFADAHLPAYAAPVVYYRLRQVDLDGTSSYSPVRTVAAPAGTVSLYPNPAHGQLTVRRPAATVATATLLNSLGQTVRALALPTAETTMNLQGLAAGVYTLRLTLDGQLVTKRVVID